MAKDMEQQVDAIFPPQRKRPLWGLPLLCAQQNTSTAVVRVPVSASQCLAHGGDL